MSSYLLEILGVVMIAGGIVLIVVDIQCLREKKRESLEYELKQHQTK